MFPIYFIIIPLLFAFQTHAGIVNVKIVSPIIYEDTTIFDAIQVYIDDPPERLCVNITTSPSGNIVPSIINYVKPRIISQKTLIAFSAKTPGIYTINVIISGMSEDRYDIVYENNIKTIEVLNNNIEPTKPIVSSIIFSNDGSSIFVHFDSNTNQGNFTNIFKCDKLLNFASIETSTCQWINLYTIQIFGAKISLNAHITILGNKILPYCAYNKKCNTNFVDEISMSCTTPLSPISPVVSISSSPQIGGCNPIVLDLSDSIGSGGRPWKLIHFTVISTDLISAKNIQTFLNDNYEISPPTQIQPSYYIKGVTYIFNVTLTNFLGQTSTGTQIVIISEDTSIPIAKIVGLNSRSIKSMDQLELSSFAYTTTCSNSGESIQTTFNLSYSWQVFLNNNMQPNIISESRDISKFKLSPFKLVSSNIYEIRLTVTNKAQKNVTTNTFITVLKGNIIASIKGPSTQSVISGDSIVIDASSSIDLDIDSNTGLLYSWSCIRILPSLGDCIFDNFNSDITTSSFVVSGNDVSVDKTSRITVRVTDESNYRVSTNYVDVTVNSNGSPIVLITTPTKLLTYINTADSAAISATVENKGESCNAVWKIDNKLIDESDVSTPIYTVVNSGAPRTISIVMVPNALAQRSTFVLSLTCKHVSSSITISTNGHPLPGIFDITPSYGIELQTLFMLSASEWYDPDLPITYMFGFKTTTSSEQSFIVQGKSQLSYGRTILPSSLTFCTVDVYDSLGASYQAITTTNVSKLSDVELYASINSQLNSLSDNTDATKQVLSTASAALNQVSCTLTSIVYCNSINRNSCLKTKNTCGTCKNNYIGEFGDKNTVCILTGTLFPNISKTCDQSCSGQGNCVIVNSDSGLYVNECKEGDSSCDAICECNYGFAGSTCESTETYINDKQTIRQSLMNSLYGLTQTEDASVDTITSWASTLDALTHNTDEISNESATISQNIALTVLDGAIINNLSPDTINGILTTIDSSTNVLINTIIKRRRLVAKSGYIDNSDLVDSENIVIGTSISKSIGLLGMYGSIVSSHIYPGQSGVKTILDSFRLSTEAVSYVDGNVVSSTPLTDTEIINGIIPTTISLNTLSDLKITTIVSKSKLFGQVGSQFNSNTVRVQLDGITSDTDIIIVLPNSIPIEFQTIISPYTFEHKCDDGDIYITNVTCPDSGFTFTFACHGWVDFMNATCPSQIQQPQCSMLNMGTDVGSTCERIAYDNMSTTCKCVIRSGNGRRLNIVDDVGVTDLVAMSKFIATEFAGTLSNPHAFSSWKDLKKVMIVLLMYSIFWGAGFGLMIFYICKRRISQTKEKHEKAELVKKKELAGKLKSPLAIHDYLTDYINSVFPKVFRNKPFLSRLYNEIIKNHRYIYLFTLSGKGSDITRILTGVQLLTTHSLLMFLIAVFYELDGPSDDGTCQYFFDKTTCLSRKSIFDVSTTYCQFTDGLCRYQEPIFSIKSIVLIGILIAFTTCIFTSPLDILFDILNAPTIISRKNSEVVNLRVMPNETVTAYNTAESSIQNVKEFAMKNRQDNTKSMIKLRENIYKDDQYEDEDIENPNIDKFTQLSYNIFCQRRIMKIDELDNFDDEWGIDPTGSFSKKTKFVLSKCKNITIDTEQILRDEITFVENETKIKVNKFKYMNDNHIGLEMLHTFVLDLLGYNSNAANIFISKTDEDYRYTKAVSARSKGISWTGIIVINLFFVYYSMMRGMIRGTTWQYAYLAGCIAQIMFEVIIAETFEVIWVHFIIPNLVAKEVKQVWCTIIDTINWLTSIEQVNVPYVINASEYLFVSTNLANEFPDLPESSIISAYHNHLPGAMSTKWKIDRASLMGLNSNNTTWIRFLTFNTIINIFKILGTSPFMIQRMIIRITSPVFIAIISWIFINIISNPIYLYIFVLVGLLLFMRLCCSYDIFISQIKKTYNKVSIVPSI